MKPMPLDQDYQFLNSTISSLTDQIDLFETFQSLSLKIISQFDIENIFSTFCEIVHEVMRYRTAEIFLPNESRTDFKKAWPKSLQEDCQFPFDEKIIHWVMEQGRWTVITDLQDKTIREVVSILPIKSPQQDHGFMAITTGVTPTIYNRKIGSILEFIASQTAIALENQYLYAKIKGSNAYLTNMLESISNGILTVDLNGQITLINKNATALLGIKNKKILHRHFSELLRPPVLKKIESIFTHALENQMLPETMINYAPYREVKIMIGITASLLTDQSGETMGVIFSFRDLSASKEIERLTRLDQMKSEFVSNVSHELRTPLSIIKSYTEALLNQVSPDDQKTRERFLKVVDTETERLAGMVSNLLDLSKLESGGIQLKFKRIDLGRLIQSLVPIYHPQLDNMRILTEIDEVPFVKADPEKIKEVLTNLINNSIKFSPIGGTIHISLTKTKDRVRCSVADTGIGIPKEQLGKIFEKFYRVDNSDTYEIEGTGLGLSIVKHIIDMHKGRVYAESHLGEGSTFTFELPIPRGER